MKLIPLFTGLSALVDDEDYDSLSLHRWSVHQTGKTIYARRIKYPKQEGETSYIYMHRQILGFPNSRIDHADRNGLNNQKSNLRMADRSQNGANSEKRPNKTSKYKGVCRAKRGNRSYWEASITSKGKWRHLGYFKTEEDAAKAYNDAAVIAFERFARINHIQGI